MERGGAKTRPATPLTSSAYVWYGKNSRFAIVPHSEGVTSASFNDFEDEWVVRYIYMTDIADDRLHSLCSFLLLLFGHQQKLGTLFSGSWSYSEHHSGD
jgi:hypothetical protein